MTAIAAADFVVHQVPLSVASLRFSFFLLTILAGTERISDGSISSELDTGIASFTAPGPHNSFVETSNSFLAGGRLDDASQAVAADLHSRLDGFNGMRKVDGKDARSAAQGDALDQSGLLQSGLGHGLFVVERIVWMNGLGVNGVQLRCGRRIENVEDTFLVRCRGDVVRCLASPNQKAKPRKRYTSRSE